MTKPAQLLWLLILLLIFLEFVDPPRIKHTESSNYTTTGR